ncbi:Oxygen-regulated invasion protein OrgB [Serratia fonticola]|uniref:Oxygen-regulated invasion protein OrgB n=1 Tax=Serratia fonticola TaxID=47917 RepID=A0A4U9TNK9_SERFO|nr:Oxygen-regulated invasion protein OrgB [Serratia fonticola]
MQNETHGNPPVQVTGVVLLTREERLRQKKGQDILQAAKVRAKNLIAQAREEQEAIRRMAYSQGYEQGVLAAASAAKSYMADYSALSLRLHQELQEKVRGVLATVLSHESIFLSLLESWSRTLDSDSSDLLPLELLIPASLGLRSGKLAQELERICGKNVRVTRHQENRYVLKYKGQLAEFIPDDFY